MEKPNNKKSSAVLSLSSCELEWVCVYEGGCLPIYTLQVTDLLTWLGQLLTLTGPTSPRETPKAHYIILYQGVFSQLTTKFVPQGPYKIMVSWKEGNTSPMGLQQYTMIIYIKISW